MTDLAKTAAPTTPVTTGAGTPRLPGLDGLRAIAVSAVMLFHLFPGLVRGGAIGVDIFFVISGFLITSLLLRERDETGRIALLSFWRRRARRLLPALGLLVVACSAGAAAIGGDTLVGLGRQVIGALTFSSNWLSVAAGADYFGQTTPELFRNLWSLAVEEQFYLVWALLVMLLVLVPRRGPRAALLLVLAVASALAMALLYGAGDDPTRAYYGTDTHSFGLAIGAALGVWAAGWPQTRLGWSRWARFLMPLPGFVAVIALVVVALVVPSDDPLQFRGVLFVVALLSAVAIAGAVVPGSALGWLLDRAPLRWVGARSYGLYLWHWPVLVLVLAALPALAPHLGWLAGLITLAITVGVAALSYRFVEQPVRRSGYRAVIASAFSSGPARVRRLVAAVCLIVLVGTTGVATAAAVVQAPQAGSAQRDIEAGQAAIDAAAAEEAAAAAASASPGPSPAPTPGLPARHDGSQITAVGDSVMLAAAPALQKALPGISIDAVVSRQMRELPGLVRSMRDDGTLRPVLLVGLGTNGPIGRDTLDAVRALLGRGHELVVVNVQAPRPWAAGVNKILASFARANQAVELANWHAAIAPRLAVLASDRIHPGPTGGRIYARAVTAALDRLAAQPPLPDTHNYGLTRRPR